MQNVNDLHIKSTHNQPILFLSFCRNIHTLCFQMKHNKIYTAHYENAYVRAILTLKQF